MKESANMRITNVGDIRFCAHIGPPTCNKLEAGECIMDIGHDTKNLEKCYGLYENIRNDGWIDDISAGLIRHNICGGRYSSGFQHRLCIMKKMHISSFLEHVSIEETDGPCSFCISNDFRKMASKSESDFLIYEKKVHLKNDNGFLKRLATPYRLVSSMLNFRKAGSDFLVGNNSKYETTYLELKNSSQY